LNKECYSCHKTNYEAVRNPDHLGQNFNKNCLICHNINAWKPTQYNHALTAFPLTGKHIGVNCNLCHTSGTYAGTPKECVSCHRSKYDATTNPNHISAKFPTTCAVCHSTSGWLPGVFDHNQTTFPLIGKHTSATCLNCHSTGYTGTSKLCYSCHKPKYDATTNPNHVLAKIPTTCETCHTSNGWTPATFDHNNTTFPLVGKHTTVLCGNCHTNGYTGTSKLCVSCHRAKYDATTNPNHVTAKIPTTCENCHTATGWTPATFDHNTTTFPLTGKHSTTTCIKCHGSGYTGTSKLCYSCHAANYTGTTNPNHTTSQFPTTCENCHSTTAWKPATFNHDGPYFPIYSGKHKSKWTNCNECHTNSSNYKVFTCITCHEHSNKTSVDSKHNGVQGYRYESGACYSCHPTGKADGAFRHETSPFPLTGAHVTLNCEQCHAGGYPNTPQACYSCHQAKYEITTKINHTLAGFSKICTDCHTTTAWTSPTYTHPTGLPFQNKHAGKTCVQCHATTYTGTTNVCSTCHLTNYQNATNPNHVAKNYPQVCSNCHTDVGWAPATFDHSIVNYTLQGKHTTVTCAQCHPNGYNNVSRLCKSCHLTDYQGTTNPNHVTGNYSQVCSDCHTETAWKPATFDHTLVNFPLTGKHIPLACVKCHANGYSNTPNKCNGCHLADYQGTTNPNHVGAQFPQTCEKCHGTTGWAPSTYDHDGQYFPIFSGKHINQWDNLCSSCHNVPTNFAAFTCIACHEHSNKTKVDSDHNGVQGYIYASAECYACHPRGTKIGSFNHSTSTFPLTGAHIPLNCNQCHTTGYPNTPNTCFGCHEQGYNITTKLNHTLAGFSHTCTDCHTTAAWVPSSYNHTTATGFPLQNRHSGKTCKQCHETTYTGTTNVCSTCHLADYQGTTNPNHVTGNFSQVCSTCHTDVGWTPATFDHSTVNYQLIGRHTTVTCVQCHPNGSYTNTSRLCQSCHLADYQGTTNPNHVTGNFSQTCSTCHTEVGWSPATFDHSTVGYQLTGRHLTVPCGQCHTSGYTNTSPLCNSCHLADFQGTTNPNHVTPHFPQTCADCHTTSAWAPSTYNHDVQYFPIYSGKHKNKWSNNCLLCHTNAGNFLVYSCIDCHEHNQASMQSKHNGVANYSWVSTRCYSCHPRGSGLMSFNHQASGFPLKGGHEKVECGKCHSSGYTNTSTECSSCHKVEYDNTVNPSHKVAKIATDCATCHSERSWRTAKYDHTFFPISSKHKSVLCNDCHSQPGFRPQCISCHKEEFNLGHKTAELNDKCYTCHNTQTFKLGNGTPKSQEKMD
jgi:hypothetical protein